MVSALATCVLLGLSPDSLLVMGWSVGPGVELPHAVLDQLLEQAVHESASGHRVVSLRDIEALLDLEQARDLVGCDDVTCTAEIGLALDTDRIVIGAIGHLGGRFHLALKVVESRSAKVVSRVNALTRREERIPGLITRAVRTLLLDEDARTGASRARVNPSESSLTETHEVQRGRVTQRWVTIHREPPAPFTANR